MKSIKLANGYLLRLERGEELVEQLNNFCKAEEIKSGWISGIGGTLKARLGYYNLNRKKYIFRAVKDARELVSLQGNISRIGEEVALHMHGVVTDSNNRARGGHVKELIVGGTCEIKIEVFDKPLQRKVDSSVGLPLLEV